MGTSSLFMYKLITTKTSKPDKVLYLEVNVRVRDEI